VEPVASNIIFKKIKEESLIPPIPEGVLKARELINDENSSLKEIASFIERDPSIAAKILRLANSAYYGFARKIDTIETALIVLGVKTTYHLLEGISLVSSFSGVIDKKFLNRLARHSIFVAIASTVISRMLDVNFHGVEYTAGLVHNLGLAAMRVVLPRESIIIEQHGDPILISCHREMELIGISHCEIGNMLADHWQLPEHIGEAMRTHHGAINDDKDLVIPSLIRYAIRVVDLIFDLDNAHRNEDDEPLVLSKDHFASCLQDGDVISEVKKGIGKADGIVDLLLS